MFLQLMNQSEAKKKKTNKKEKKKYIKGLTKNQMEPFY